MDVSLTNYLAATSTVVSAVSASSSYPVANVKTAGDPFTPYNSGSAGAGQIITWDYGVAMPVSVWAVGRLNFTSLTIQADDAATFNSAAGSPQFSQVITAAEALNSRIHGSYRSPTPVNRRHNRMLIANQTTVATAPTTKYFAGASTYLVGWIWAGPVESAFLDVLADPDLEREEPVDDVPLPSGGRSRSLMGYPFITIKARRVAESAADLSAALALDRAWSAVDAALVLTRPSPPWASPVPSDAYVMRRLKGWAGPWGTFQSEGDVILEEVAN